MAQNRNLFRLTRWILLKVPALFKLFAGWRKPQKRLLIIKTDAIGDYVLFRNFIEVLKRSEKYKEYQIDLLANPLCRDLAEKYDAPFLDQLFFTKPDALYHQPLKTLSLGWQLFRRNYEQVLQPTYARTFINDGLAGLSVAKELTGFSGTTERIDEKYKRKTDRFYTRLIELPESVFFEFDRTRFFFETVLDGAVDLYGPQLPVSEDKSGIVIFPGAGVIKRSWEREKFVELIKQIKANSDDEIVLAGGPSETEVGEYIVAAFPAGGITNQINKTSLTELVELISEAKLIISNETSAIHIAAATKTKAVCILGGGHFGRFAPYPAYMENAPICVYHPMECFNCNWNCIYPTTATEPYPCIGNVTVEAVWREVQQHL
jgi:ADP-heptose:LPS heptosyltransferase